MESLFRSNEEFFEGEVFAPTEAEFLRIRSSGRRRKPAVWLRESGIAATARTVVVAVAMGAATNLVPTPAATANAAVMPPWTIEVSVPPESAPDPGDFCAARKSLKLSQPKAAAVLHVSESALEKFEQGQVEPGRAFAARYLALIELNELLSTAFGKDEELRNAYLHGKGAFFGGRSALEWAAQSSRTDAITEVKSVFSRTLT